MKSLKILFITALIFFAVKITFSQSITLIERTLESSQDKILNVQALSGDVRISTWDKNQVNVRIKGDENALKYIDYTIESKDGNIIVKTEKKSSLTVLIEKVKLSIEVTVPLKYNADVKTTGGDIKISQLTGNVKFETAGGDITANDITGELDLVTAGGDIKASNFKGKIKAATAGGDVRLDGSEGEVNAETSGGDVKLDYTGNNFGISLKTMGGSIKLKVPETFKAELDISTTGGEIKSDFPLLINKGTSGQTMKGDINGGGKLVKCTTMGGDISIRK